MNERDRIVAILHANPGNERANEALRALAAHPDATFTRTGPLPRDHVLAMLRRRAQIAEAGLSRPGTYAAPLESLAAAGSVTVHVEAATVGDRELVIITTPEDALVDVLILAPR
jgi:hypothetical protein